MPFICTLVQSKQFYVHIFCSSYDFSIVNTIDLSYWFWTRFADPIIVTLLHSSLVFLMKHQTYGFWNFHFATCVKSVKWSNIMFSYFFFFLLFFSHFVYRKSGRNGVSIRKQIIKFAVLNILIGKLIGYSRETLCTINIIFTTRSRWLY